MAYKLNYNLRLVYFTEVVGRFENLVHPDGSDLRFAISTFSVTSK